MNSKPIIPIVTINWNGFQDTLECVQSLKNQSLKNFQLYLLDNNSDYENVNLLQRHFDDISWIHLYFSEENLGFTRGCNYMMKEILKEDDIPSFIILLNNDTVVDEYWFENITKSAKQNKASIVSSKMIDYHNNTLLDNVGHLMLNTGEIISKGHHEPIEKYDEVFENIGACGGGALYSTAMLQDIGIFDEFFDTGYEDAELGLRAVMAGHKCVFEPSAIVHHKMGQSIKKIFDYHYILKVLVATWYTYFKLVPTPVILINIPFFILKYSITILMLLFTGKWTITKALLGSIWITLTKKRKVIQEARSAFYNSHRKLSSIALMKKQKFFLLYDLKRFYRLFISKQQKMFDKYQM